MPLPDLPTDTALLAKRWAPLARLLSWRPRTASVFGLPVYVGTSASFCDEFLARFEEFKGLGACIGSPDSYAFVLTRHDRMCAAAMKAHVLLMPDGGPIASLARRQCSSAQRCRGADTMKTFLCKSADRADVKHFLLGATEDVLARLKVRAEQEWGNNNIVGTYAPPYVPDWRGYGYDDISARIKASGANVLWVALGTPKQNFFSVEIAHRLPLAAIFPVGAAFNFHSGQVPEAPAWMRTAPIPVEWIHRMVSEPRRLVKRYAYTVPWFLYYGLRELLSKPPKQSNP